MITSLGKKKRLNEIFRNNGKVFLVPIDDLLISGPLNHLEDFDEKIKLMKDLPIDAVLGFPGVFNGFYKDLCDKSWVVNLTTSTFMSNHTYKRRALTLENAIYNGASAVAVHVNVSAPDEGRMIKNLGEVSSECQALGIPLLAIMYARRPGKNGDDNYEVMKREDNVSYTNMICHTCRIAVELGADIIKTNFTGSEESFKRVVKASGDVPVVIAGGPKVSESQILLNARQAVAAGAAGVCFGRNFFYRNDLSEFAEQIDSILKNG